VVDDDVNLCKSLMDVLNQKGYRVSFANDGISAIEKVRSGVFDILLLDMKLPPLNGLETYLTIHRLCPSLVVVIITGFGPEMDYMISMATKNGAYALLEKPIDIDKLLDVLSQIENINESD